MELVINRIYTDYIDHQLFYVDTKIHIDPKITHYREFYLSQHSNLLLDYLIDKLLAIGSDKNGFYNIDQIEIDLTSEQLNKAINQLKKYFIISIAVTGYGKNVSFYTLNHAPRVIYRYYIYDKVVLKQKAIKSHLPFKVKIQISKETKELLYHKALPLITDPEFTTISFDINDLL